jgi:hypothetical protein
MPADQTLSVIAVIAFATVIRSAFGFGEALVAVPLLALFIPVEVAAPLAVLVSVTVAGIILLRDWREVHADSAGRLVLSTTFGIPFGLLLLISVPEPVVKAVLAVVIITFSASRLVGRSRWELKDDRLAWLFGSSRHLDDDPRIVSIGGTDSTKMLQGSPHDAKERLEPRDVRHQLDINLLENQKIDVLRELWAEPATFVLHLQPDAGLRLEQSAELLVVK